MEVVFRNVSFSYNKNTPFETKALKDINLFLQSNLIHGIIGPIGSGKSTLLELMNGVTKTYTGGLKISSTVNYEVRVKSQTSQFTSTTSNRTLPLDLVSLQLSGVNGAQPAVSISTTNQLILQGTTTNGNVVEYDMIYKAKPIEDQYLFINQQETFSTQLMFEMTPN